MARRDEDNAASSAAKKAQDIVEMNEEDEEAIRAKLRQSGWDKKKLLKLKEGESAAGDKKTDAKDKHGDDAEKKTPTKDKDVKDKDKDGSSKRGASGRDDKDRDRERDRDDKDKDKDRRSGRGSRRSRSARRRDKDRDRDRDRDRRRDRDRGSRRNRSRSASKSRSRSTSIRRRDKDRGRDRERSSRADKRRSRSRSASASRSRSVSKSRASKRSRTEEKKSEKPSTEETSDDKKHDETKLKEEAENPAAETNGEKKTESKPKDKEKDDRKSRRSSRHRSRSASRSPSRSSRHRRRRHRSPSRSRSASRSRRDRGRGGSRSRSRSHRRRSSRRRHSRSRSRSRSSYSRRRRSKSNDRGRRNANSSPSPGQHPPTAAAPAAPGVPGVVNPVNPTITQLMQQYPTMSLQDIIAKMQASNLTMAAAVSMKPARELYVGNLPPSITGPQLQEFLGTIIQQVGLTVQPGNPILSTWISTDGHFAFCEMRSIEECNMALMLNQLPLLGQPLKFGRPKSFMGPPQPMPTLSARTQTALTNLGCTPNPVWFATPSISDLSSVASMTASLTSAIPGFAATAAPLGVAPFAAPLAAPVPVVAATNGVPSNKLVMSNIPAVLTEDQVKELVQPFGELKSFQLIVVPGQPTGSALFEYEDESVTDDAVKGLDGLELGPDPLVVRRAAASEEETGPVLKLANMVSIDELNDDEEFADLKDDVEEECKRFGSVVALEIPRPNNEQDVPGLGSIFVQFETTGEAAAALKALSGRKFGGNIVKVSYFPIAKFQQKDFV